jgi:hypothetical protein
MPKKGAFGKASTKKKCNETEMRKKIGIDAVRDRSDAIQGQIAFPPEVLTRCELREDDPFCPRYSIESKAGRLGDGIFPNDYPVTATSTRAETAERTILKSE